MVSIIQYFRIAFLVMSMLVVGASAFSSTNAGFISSQAQPTTIAPLRKATFLSMSSAAAMLPEGLVKTVVEVGSPNAAPIARGDIVTVKYTCYSTTGDDSDNILLARSDSQKMVVGDGAMVPGWDAALRTMTVGERAVVRLTDPSLGYGSDPRAAPALEALGTDPSNAQLEFDIMVQTVQPAAQAADLFDMNFDTMALADNTPKTAQEIAEAYQIKMANKAPELEGLEGWIDTVKNWYFFGFFEGETGEEAPWYLKPSITFPIAFAIVGAAFYVSLLSGAISEKGAQSIDELDVIVTSIVTSVPGF